MMPIYLEQRFHLLLNLAKESDNLQIARENLAAAKEMIDTLFATGHLTIGESRDYRSACTAVGIMISRAELERLPAYDKFSDGMRQIQN
jgi:dsDNA-specific endonuclease/ATPase MutS2